jgi:lysophospholipase L1-like esterase
MRSNRAWILVGAALATGVGVAFVLRDRHPKIDADSRILLVGDSLSLGLGPQLRAMAEEAGLPFVALGVQGTTISDWAGLRSSAHADALAATLESFRPTIILVSLGTNDEYLSAAALDAEADDVDALLELLESYGDVVWIGVPELPKEASNGAVELITATDVPYFPSERLDIPRAPDDLHPTVAGYGSWAGMLWTWLT